MNFLIDDFNWFLYLLILTYYYINITIHISVLTEICFCCTICILIVILNCYYLNLCILGIQFYNLSFYVTMFLYNDCKLDYFHIS
jgi:hypothetical protein